MKLKAGPSCSAPKGWGSGSLTPFSLSQGRKIFLPGVFPLGAEQCQPGGWNNADKIKLFFLPILCSQVFCSTVLLKFLKGAPELSQSCFCSWIVVSWLIFVGGWRLGSPRPPFWQQYLLFYVCASQGEEF